MKAVLLMEFFEHETALTVGLWLLFGVVAGILIYLQCAITRRLLNIWRQKVEAAEARERAAEQQIIGLSPPARELIMGCPEGFDAFAQVLIWTHARYRERGFFISYGQDQFTVVLCPASDEIDTEAARGLKEQLQEVLSDAATDGGEDLNEKTYALLPFLGKSEAFAEAVAQAFAMLEAYAAISDNKGDPQ